MQTKASPPLYVWPAYELDVRVHSWNPATGQVKVNWTLNRGLFARGILIPQNAAPAVNTDSTIDIYQPSTDRLWELWKVGKDAAGQVGGGVGWADRRRITQRWDPSLPLCTAATGDSLVGGEAPRIEELQARQINHPVES